MNRPKKDFIPTSLSDLNIDSISLGSNSDRHNNNSNGARFNNLDRSKATSSFNLASHHPSHPHSNNSSFSRASKAYGSQSNISSNVNNFNVNSPASSVVDPWEQAWEDNNNAYRPPSYQPKQQREHSISKPNQSFKHSHSAFDFNRTNSINQTTSNRSMNHYVEDPFDDPWAGMISYQLFFYFSHKALCTKNCTHANSSSVVIIIVTFHVWVMETRMSRRTKDYFILFCLLIFLYVHTTHAASDVLIIFLTLPHKSCILF